MAGIFQRAAQLAGLVAATVVLADASFAMSPKPFLNVNGTPAPCLSMDMAPYSAPESLEVVSAARRSHFTVEIAGNDADREQGLMCRRELKPGEGMLFEFPDAGERNFWMENTLIGLDIIYVAPDGHIVSIQKNAKPLDRTPLPSKGAASGVLEIAGGLSDKLGIKPGDRIEHPFFHTH